MAFWQDLLLADPGFVRLLASRTLAMLARGFAPVAIAFGVLGLPGGNATTLSLVLASEMVPLLIFLLPGGVLGDRYSRPSVIGVGAVLAVIGLGAFAVMFLTGWGPLWALCLAAVLDGTSGALSWPAFNGIIPDIVPAERFQRGNALLSMGASTARLFGLIAGGAVVVLMGPGWAVACAALMFAVTAVIAFQLPHRKTGLAGATESPWKQLAEGWQEFRSRQWLWVVVIQWALMMLAMQAFIGVLGPVLANEELGGAGAWAAFTAAEGFGALLGVVVAMMWHPQRPILVGTLACLLAGAPAILLGVSAPFGLVLVAAVLNGLGFELFGVLWMTALQTEVPPEALSRVGAYDALGSLLFTPVGLVLAGPMILVWGLHPALIACGVFMIVIVAAALLSPDVRTLRLQAPATQ